MKDNYADRFKITHTVPDLTDEEREQKKKEILLKLYNVFSNQNNTIDTKVKL